MSVELEGGSRLDKIDIGRFVVTVVVRGGGFVSDGGKVMAPLTRGSLPRTRPHGHDKGPGISRLIPLL